VDRWVPKVVDTSPHDPAAFTEGLVVRGDTVYESTGRYEQSTVRIVDRESGDVRLLTSLDPALFGEGLEMVSDRLIQLTWREGTSIVWDATTLEEVGRFTYEGDGWGLCFDGDRLVMSDGSADLTFRDRVTFAPTGKVTVTRQGEPVTMLNELECVDGLVFANVWQTTDIVVIEPESGEVTAVIDAALLDTIDDTSGAAVLNGIAYDSAGDVFLVTGKLWPTMFEVRFVEE
jgi:glutaminyl-peptide cyclotransferase